MKVKSAFGQTVMGRFRWEKWKVEKRGDKFVPVEKVAESSDWQNDEALNMITNYGMRGWATRPLCENFVIGVIGTGQTQDVRYPTFTLNPGTNIGARSGNAVKITGTTDTTLFSAGDILVYDDASKGQFFISSRVVNGADIDLVLKNMDGSEPTGTTASGSDFWIYRASQTALQTEYKRSGTPSKANSTPAADSDPDTVGGYGFISADTVGPIIAGSGAVASATLASGAVSAVTVSNGGSNYVKNSPPTVLFKGGDAGKFITGQITGTSNDSGQVVDGGTGYSNVAGNVTIQLTGPGRNATFTVNVSGGVIQSVDIDAAGEGYFEEEYSTAKGNLVIKDSTGSGSGGSIKLTPRRQATGEAIVSNGQVSAVRVTYGGYKLTGAPSVTFFDTAYRVHERTWAFTLETGSVSIAEWGVSHDRAAGNNLFARQISRNASTGAVDPVALVNGEQFRLTYQLIENIAPASATEVNSAMVGGWGLQGGELRFEYLGLSSVAGDGFTSWHDAGLHANEPYFNAVTQMPNYVQSTSPDSSVNSALKAYISESFAGFASLGSAVDRATGVDWSAQSVKAPVITYIEDNTGYFPTKITKKANWSIASGNDVEAVNTFGLGFVESTGNPPKLVKIALTHLFNSTARGQASGQGKPEKLNTHTLELSFETTLARRF